MRAVPPEEIRFLLKRGVQKLPRSILRDLGGSDEKRTAALDLAVDIMFPPFERLTIEAPDPPMTTFQARGVGSE